MGRAPCCDKANVKKGPWSPEEDATLKSYIDENGTGNNWIALPQKIGLKRCGKSCRLRWLNYLRPNLKHGGFSEEEDNIICSLYVSIGSRWSIIAAQLPGRTDNDIKNYWNTRLKKKLLGKHRKEAQASRQNTQKRALNPYQYHTIATSPFVGVDHQHGLFESGQMPYWPDLKPVLTLPVPSVADHHQQQASVKDFGVRDQGVFQSGLESLQAELSELINYKNYQQEEVLLLDGGEINNYPPSNNNNNNSEGFYENIGSSTATSSASFDSSIESSYFAYNYVENALPQDYSGFEIQDQQRCYFGTNY